MVQREKTKTLDRHFNFHFKNFFSSTTKMASRRGPETITCPYNPFHQILPHRIQYHLIKCKKNYPDVRLSTCPYNATHLMPKEEMKRHMERCLDRRIVEVQKYNVPLPG